MQFNSDGTPKTAKAQLKSGNNLLYSLVDSRGVVIASNLLKTADGGYQDSASQKYYLMEQADGKHSKVLLTSTPSHYDTSATTFSLNASLGSGSYVFHADGYAASTGVAGTPLVSTTDDFAIGNSAPRITLSSGTVTIQEDGTGNITYTESDVDGGPVTVTASSSEAKVAATIDTANKKIVLTPAANWNGGNVKVTITITDDQNAVGTAELTVTVNAVNDAATITATTTALAYTEGAGAVVVDNALTLTVGDMANLTGASVWLSNNYTAAEDSLAFTNTAKISGSYNATTGVLTLTTIAGQTATVADYQAAMRTVTYSDASQNPNLSDRTVSLKVTDGTTDSATATRKITVAAVDNAPTVANAPANVSQVESGNLASPATGTIDYSNVFTDVDNPAANITVSFNNSNSGVVSLAYDPATKVLTWTQVGIGTATITATGTSNGKTVTDAVDITAQGKTPTINANNLNVNVSSGAQVYNLAMGLAGTLQTDAQIIALAQFAVTDNSLGVITDTAAFTSKTGWYVDSTTKDIRVPYNVNAGAVSGFIADVYATVNGTQYPFTVTKN